MSVYGKDTEDLDQQQQQLQQLEQPMASSSSSDIRSGTSSSTNSDSGIGYRDDPDNVLLMDPQSPPIRLHDQQLILGGNDLQENAVEGLEVEENEINEEKERFDVRAMPPPKDLVLSPPGNYFSWILVFHYNLVWYCSDLECCTSLHCAIFGLKFFGLKVGILGTKFPQYVRPKGITNWSLYMYMAARFK